MCVSISYLLGGAGTGKSSLLLLIVEKLIAKHGRHTVFITATTGLAACAVSGKSFIIYIYVYIYV
jgi:ATP-dependent DNA helicase PIF1